VSTNLSKPVAEYLDDLKERLRSVAELAADHAQSAQADYAELSAHFWVYAAIIDVSCRSLRVWPRPFLGLCSYYRRFVSQFASVAAPLHRLQNKNVTFEWGAKEEDAFQELKRRLMTTPILGMPTDEGTYYLDTDACESGLGAVLSQDQRVRRLSLLTHSAP